MLGGLNYKKEVLNYSIQGENGDKKIIDAVTKAAEKWNENLNGIQLLKTTPLQEMKTLLYLL